MDDRTRLVPRVHTPIPKQDLRMPFRLAQRGLRSNFFNSFWIYGAIIVLIIGMAAGQPALSILGLLTLITATGSWLWGRASLDHLSYQRTLSAERIFQGETVVMEATIVNRKWLPLPWLSVEDQISDRVLVREREILPSNRPGMTLLRLVTSVRWYERVSWTFNLDCPERGAYNVGPVSMRSGDLFGFFSRSSTIEGRDQIIVYPRIVPLEEIGLPPLHPFGDQRRDRHLITDPSRPIGIRDYRPEDSFRYIHWKATARQGQIQVKVFEPTVTVQIGIFLSLDTYERYWEGVDYNRAESAIVAAASLSAHGLKERCQVGVYANGVMTNSDQTLRIHPGRGPDQLGTILQGLAKLTPLSSTNFPRLLSAEARRFPWGSTIVVISALMTDALALTLAELLTRGHRVVLLRVGDYEPPALRDLVVHTMPDNLIGQTDDRSHYVVSIDASGDD